MKILITALAIMVLLGTFGCTAQPSIPPGGDSVAPPAENPEGDSAGVVLPADAPPADITWISPGKVNVGNFYPGARAEYPITIHNGNDYACSFEISYRYPDHTGEGYDSPPAGARDWVIVADTTPVLMPQETREILIVLEVPEGARVDSQHWEFWISVIDTTQTGMIRTELCCRWLIDMRT